MHLSRHIDPERLIMVAVCVMVSAAVGVSILNAGPDLAIARLLAASGVVVYLGLLLTHSRWVRPGGSRFHAVAFFAAMFLATAWIMAALVQLRVLGAGLQFLGAAWLLDNGPGLLLEALAGFAAATVFVTLFVHLARSCVKDGLADLRMPKVDGVQATGHIRERYSFCRILVLTTFDDDELVCRALQAGASGYLLKDADHEAALPEALTHREREILRLLATGISNKQIGHRLSLAEGTVKNYMTNILAKLDVTDRTQAVIKATRIGLA